MVKALDLKNIEDIISSYETRIESISSIFDTTYLILSDFQEATLNNKEEREKVNTQLRDILAKNEHLRRKDFDNMMQGLLSAQDQREREVKNLLRNYLNDQKAMAQALRENLRNFKESLAKGKVQRVKEFQASIKEILAKQDKRRNEVTSKLKEFQNEQNLLSSRLRELLVKGREVRIRDLKSMLRGFEAHRERRFAHQRKRKEEVAEMLNGFKKARAKIRPLLGAVNIDAHNEREKEGVSGIDKEIERRE